MKKNLFSEWLRAVLLLLLAQPIFAQQNSKIIFPNPIGFHTSQGLTLAQTAGGNYFIAGTADASDWNTIGAYVLPRVVKLNSDLTTAWDNVYLAPPTGNGVWTEPEGKIYETPDGGAVVALRQDSVLLIERDFMKVNADGSLAWVADLPGTAWKSTVVGVLANGTTVVARWNYNPDNAFHIVQVDASGAVILDKSVAGLNPNTSTGIGLPNGDILFSSYNNVSKKHDLYRIDNQGNILWTVAGIGSNVYHLFGFADGSVGAWVYLNPQTTNLAFFTANGQPDGSVPQPIVSGLVRNVVGADGKNLILSGSLTTGRGFLQKINALDGTTIWEAEVPGTPPPVVEDLVAGTPTTDSWGAGVSGGWDDKQLGFFKVGGNTGIQINTLTGRVAKDDNTNCIVETGEVKIGHTQITATNGSETHWTFADANGNYSLQLPAGTFDLEAKSNQLFFGTCPSLNTTVTFTAGPNSSAALDFPMQALQTIHSISGKVVLDQNSDCLADAGDTPLENWNLRLTGSNGLFINLKTNAAGEYSIFVPDGDFNLEFYTLNANFSTCGQKVRTISVSGTPQNLVENFVVDPLVDCAAMQTSIATAAVRPCSTRVLQVFYRNDGTQPASAATLDVTLDPALDFVSATPAANSVSGDVLHFELGTVPPSYASTWYSIQITVLADCALQIGQQLCITSEVAPAVPCNTPPNWQGAIIAVDGYCDEDSAYFEIKNIGNGPQVAPLDFVIVEDQIVLKQGNFNLPPGGIQAENAMYFQDSTSLMMTADQEPGAPAQDPVVFNLTNCSGMNGGGNSGGGGGSMFTAQQCFLVTNSYDPNDKNAYPLGFGASHIVQPGTPLEYTIRFQNTGNDTAFTVVLRDTLDKNFDFARIELLGSSHRYSFAQIENSVLHFRFDNILLPDSATNLAASQGYVQVRVYPKANLPLGTEVKNRAAIYFDFNPPIITNTVSRIYDDYFVYEVSSDEPTRSGDLKIAVAPNPFVTETYFKLPADAPAGNYRLEIFDAAGRQIRSLEFSGNQCRLGREGLPQGLLFWKISENGQLRASGKILTGE